MVRRRETNKIYLRLSSDLLGVVRSVEEFPPSEILFVDEKPAILSGKKAERETWAFARLNNVI